MASGGATNQSLPNASVAPASRSDRNAYVPFARSAADDLLGPPAIVDRVVRLHAGDDAELAEPRDLRRGDVLRVLNAEATIPLAVFFCDALEDVELGANRPVADGVHDHVEAGFVGTRNPSVQILGRVDEEPRVGRYIGKRLEERCRMRA